MLSLLALAPTAGPSQRIVASFPFLLVASTHGATTYYVSPSGSDVNAGTLPDLPWRTLARASQQHYTAGDALLLERNATWVAEPLEVAGVSIIGAYGNSSLPQPRLLHSRPLSATVACVTAINATRLVVRDLHMAGCSVGLALVAPPAPGGRDVLVERNFFSDIRTPSLQYSPANPAWAPAIEMRDHFTNLTIRNNLATRVDVFYQNSGSATGLVLQANTVQQCSGNCYSIGGAVTGLRLRDSVFLRDTSERMFLYGTTDVILGTLHGDNQIFDNDFNQRGEYQGSADGCAIDFETAANDIVVRGNTFARSWGAGVMVFGHTTTSQNLTIDGNVFNHAGCVQSRGDQGSIAVMCPGYPVRPSGRITSNAFFLGDDPACAGVEAIHKRVPDCDANLTVANNSVDAGAAPVEMPQVNVLPPPPTSTATSGEVTVVGMTKTEGATLRYTLDGSRPTAAAAALPADGIKLAWPAPAVVVNVRGFADGRRPSVTNGVVFERDLVVGRAAPRPPVGAPAGMIDSVDLDSSTVRGWAVDTSLPGGGLGPVTVVVEVDGEPAAAALANEPRPDLVPAGVAPNPEHGFTVVLPAKAAAALRGAGRHAVGVQAVGTPGTATPFRVGAAAFCGGAPC